MRKARFNRFTRLFLAGLSILLIGLVLYVGRALAQVKPQEQAGRHIERVTILPDRIMMPPQINGMVVLTDYVVETSIKDNVAVTTITQTYKNETSQTLEARYLFPLPTDANFSSFTLTVNGKALEGKVLEKDEARNTYQEIVRKLIDPGLLEYIDDKTVQVSIAPFFAGEAKTIKLSYTQLLAKDGGLYKYAYFLGSQKPGTLNRPGRPMPLRETKIAPEKNNAPNLTLNLDLKTAQALKTIYSPTHDPKIDRKNDHQAGVKLLLKPSDIQAEKNFVLYFSQDSSKLTLNTLSYQKTAEDGYFLMSVRTPENIRTEVLPKDMVLVIDTSGSMGGEKIKQAKEALKYIINHLRPDDRFGLLQFNTDVSALKNELIPASSANKQAALEYVESLTASGSTNIEAALKDGFSQLKNHDAKRPAYVIFLTDGEPTVGVTDTDGLVKTAEKANTHNAHLFNFGVGYDLNAMLLNKLSDGNHGSTTFVEPNENLELAMTSFYKKIEAPVLTDTALDFGGLQVKKIYPEKLGDLFAGSEVILLGRYNGTGDGTVKLSGKVGGQAQSYSFPVHWTNSTAHSQLPRLWAGRRIAYLLDHIRQQGENKELKEDVIALSKQYGIITPYTSFLAIEPEQDRSRQAAMPPGVMLSGSAMPAAAPMASQRAMDASSGQGAVQFSKRLNAMKAQSSAQALNAAQESRELAADEAPTLKTIGTKTFLHAKDGVWTDTAYDEKAHGKPQQVTFGTDAYFKLLSDEPELLPYFSVGEQVLVLLDGKAYQVLPVKTH